MSLILPKVPEHLCDRPWRAGGYGSTGQPDGTIFVCPTCKKAWVSRPCYEHHSNTSKWHPVRWWNWRLRKRITENT
jgi:hypothetical protein